MVLKRNGLGQLGFHIQSEGIVTDVEPYGFAWEVGLRKGSRLVEICKVATITLTHDQIVDLLRTSAVVKVVVVPPLEDGTPRYKTFFKSSLFVLCVHVITIMHNFFLLYFVSFFVFCCVYQISSCFVASGFELQFCAVLGAPVWTVAF